MKDSPYLCCISFDRVMSGVWSPSRPFFKKIVNKIINKKITPFVSIFDFYFVSLIC